MNPTIAFLVISILSLRGHALASTATNTIDLKPFRTGFAKYSNDPPRQSLFLKGVGTGLEEGVRGRPVTMDAAMAQATEEGIAVGEALGLDIYSVFATSRNINPDYQLTSLGDRYKMFDTPLIGSSFLNGVADGLSLGAQGIESKLPNLQGGSPALAAHLNGFIGGYASGLSIYHAISGTTGYQPVFHPCETFDYHLQGIVHDQHGYAAIINNAVYRKGDSAAGAELVKISSATVMLKCAGTQRRLEVR
jgi:hypothetical protein